MKERSHDELDARVAAQFNTQLDEQRTLRALVPLVLLGAGLIAATAVPVVGSELGLAPLHAAIGCTLIVSVISVATVVYQRCGPSSRTYVWVDAIESTAIQLTLVGLALLTTRAAGVWWVLLLAHSLLLGNSGRVPRGVRLAAVLGPTIAAGVQAIRGDYAALVTALAVGVLSGYLIQIGEATARRTAALHAEREQLLAKLSNLRLTEDRRRIARELHDGVAADLVALTARLERLHREAERDAMRSDLAALRARTANGIEELRSIVWALRSPARGWHELVGFARERCRELCASDARFSLEVTTEEAPEIPGQVALSALRILQELVRNAARHSGASSVEVLLAFEDGRVKLRVTDDGERVDAQALSQVNARQEGGLANVRDRAKEAGGAAWFRTCAPHGLVVDVELPLERAPTNHPLTMGS